MEVGSVEASLVVAALIVNSQKGKESWNFKVRIKQPSHFSPLSMLRYPFLHREVIYMRGAWVSLSIYLRTMFFNLQVISRS